MKQVKTMWTWRAGQKWYRQPRVWIIIMVLLIAGAVASIVVSLCREAEEATTEDNYSSDVLSEEYLAAQAAQVSIETYCQNQFTAYQEAGAIADSIEVTNDSNYEDNFALIEDEYDSQGRAIYRFRWMAYDTATAGDVSVVCYVASGGTDDHDLQQLTVDGALIGGFEYYEIYNSAGELQRDSNGCWIDGSGNC